MRNSDVQACMYWLARMLEGGEDPLYIARRAVRMASEDIGMADSRALEITIAAYQACMYLGMPGVRHSSRPCDDVSRPGAQKQFFWKRRTTPPRKTRSRRSKSRCRFTFAMHRLHSWRISAMATGTNIRMTILCT